MERQRHYHAVRESVFSPRLIVQLSVRTEPIPNMTYSVLEPLSPLLIVFSKLLAMSKNLTIRAAPCLKYHPKRELPLTAKLAGLELPIPARCRAYVEHIPVVCEDA